MFDQSPTDQYVKVNELFIEFNLKRMYYSLLVLNMVSYFVGQTSNFLDLNGESETEELVVKSISRIGGVLDNQLANGVKGNVSEDQKSIGTTVMVQVKMESRKPAEAAAETIGEMHLDITVPSDTTLTPLDASAVKKGI